MNNKRPFCKSHSKNFIAYIVLRRSTRFTAQPSAGGLYNCGAINVFKASIHLRLNSSFPTLLINYSKLLNYKIATYYLPNSYYDFTSLVALFKHINKFPVTAGSNVPL